MKEGSLEQYERSFFFFKSAAIVSYSKKKNESLSEILEREREFTRLLLSSHNPWKYERKNRMVYACLEFSHILNGSARVAITLTHQLHLVTNVSVTNRRQ